MDYKPIRKINNRGSRKNTGLFPSLKNERSVAFESLIELDFLYLLEFDRKVVSYFEQPLKIKYFYKDRNRIYTPDLLVNRIDKIQIIEIKPYNEYVKIMDDEDKRQKYIVADKYCNSVGYEFKFVTENNIRSGNFLNNIKYLFDCSKRDVPASERLLIRNMLISTGTVSINDLINLLEVNNNDNLVNYYAYILSLIYSHNIYTDLSKKLDRNSFISLEGGST